MQPPASQAGSAIVLLCADCPAFLTGLPLAGFQHGPIRWDSVWRAQTEECPRPPLPLPRPQICLSTLTLSACSFGACWGSGCHITRFCPALSGFALLCQNIPQHVHLSLHRNTEQQDLQSNSLQQTVLRPLPPACGDRTGTKKQQLKGFETTQVSLCSAC